MSLLLMSLYLPLRDFENPGSRFHWVWVWQFIGLFLCANDNSMWLMMKCIRQRTYSCHIRRLNYSKEKKGHIQTEPPRPQSLSQYFFKLQQSVTFETWCLHTLLCSLFITTWSDKSIEAFYHHHQYQPVAKLLKGLHHWLPGQPPELLSLHCWTLTPGLTPWLGWPPELLCLPCLAPWPGRPPDLFIYFWLLCSKFSFCSVLCAVVSSKWLMSKYLNG